MDRDRLNRLERQLAQLAQQMAGLPIRVAEGGAGGSTSNSVAKAVVTTEAGASTHSSSGITYGTVGECVLLDEDGNKQTGDDGVPLEVKSLHRVKLAVDVVIELSAPDPITPGSTWAENKVVGRLAEVTDYLKELTGFAQETALYTSDVAATDIKWGEETCEA